MSEETCSCGNNGIKLIYACSGAANTGKAADKTARLLSKEGFGKMTCLAALGADLSGLIESAKSAEKNIIIDGCPVACGKKIFEKHGISNYVHFIAAQMGVVKGQTKVTDELIQSLASKIKEDPNTK